jgi:hypothetical protein
MTDDPFSGSWTILPARSRLAGPPPGRWTQTIAVAGESLQIREEITGVDGRSFTVTVDAAFDGRDYPVHGSPLVDTIAYARPSPRRIEGIARKEGRVVLTESVTVSDDAHTLTMGYVMRLPDGREVNRVAVFERHRRIVE